MNLKEAKAARDEAIAAYRAIETTANQDDLRKASDAVKAARKAVSDTICAGAVLCPLCDAEPIGIEHPNGRGGVEFEVGCPVCPPFERTDDGTRRRVAARGGLLPRHAVEAWNEGPDHWALVRREAR